MCLKLDFGIFDNLHCRFKIKLMLEFLKESIKNCTIYVRTYNELNKKRRLSYSFINIL
jgi:hypothetical protein